MNCSVRVAVRVRPLLEDEKAAGETNCVKIFPTERQVHCGEAKYTFDFVFGVGSAQAEVYSECVEPLIHTFFQGYNATIFAYGQTGSGKTFTMGSYDCEGVSHVDLGILPRTFQLIQAEVESLRACQSVTCHLAVQFLEIYGTWHSSWH
jgi:hypothetical protein